MANQQGNMYEFITKTWNPLGGKCEFDSIPSKLNVYDRIYKDTVSLCEVLGIDLIKFG